MNTLELAEIKHVEEYYEIIKMGREFQQEQGFTQWTEAYPDLNTIRDDIRNQKGYALKADGEIAGYMCIDFDGEPAYKEIEGKWRLDGRYAVVHRLAIHTRFRGLGLADSAFRLIEGICRQNMVSIIRADTDFPNTRMQHILMKNGYVNCGTVTFKGGPKLAYDKILKIEEGPCKEICLP